MCLEYLVLDISLANVNLPETFSNVDVKEKREENKRKWRSSRSRSRSTSRSRNRRGAAMIAKKFDLLRFALLYFSLLCFALLCFILLCFALFCFALLCFALLYLGSSCFSFSYTSRFAPRDTVVLEANALTVNLCN
ncbi:hypothetical protein V1477_007410 [Vespula maculifrons]|uniref:Transmembrane protein n=1 Tax=Vespula maculifrons TaxID=7453 RepID=A0ABD2CIE3_VESMC